MNAGRKGPRTLGNGGFIYNDGGRAAAGFKGSTGDCVTRAVTIATGLPYRQVYDALGRVQESLGKARSARNGVRVQAAGFKNFMRSQGFVWTPTMLIGSGCKVHLDAAELPAGVLVVSVSRHYTCMIDGIIHDTFDPRDRAPTIYTPDFPNIPKYAKRMANGNWLYAPKRCVYGYWRLPCQTSAT